MRKLKLFLSVLMLMAFSVGTVFGATTYKLTKVTSVSAGNKYVFEQNSHVFNNTCASSALQTTATYSTTKLTGTESYVWTLETATGGFYLKNVSLASNQYLNNTSKTTVSLGSANSIWTIAFTDGVALISNTSNANRYLGQPAAETYTYKAYATSDMSYAHAITVYQLEEEAACSNTVTITKGAETNGTYTLSATEICGDGEGEDVTISAITPKAGYAFDEITTSASGTVDNANTKVTGITANTTITVLFKELQKYTVKFNTGAGNPAQADIPETTAGEGITLPAGPTPACSSAGWSFAGWAEDAVALETTTAPTLLAAGDNYKPADNVTLYAVYKRVEGGSGESGTVTITHDSKDFPTAYGDANKFTEYTLEGYKFKIQQVYVSGSGDNKKMQWRAAGNSSGTGTIYNSQAYPAKISSIILTYHSSEANKNHTLKVGDAENPTGGTTITGSTDGFVETFDCSKANADYFVLANGEYAGYTVSIAINYGNAGTTYYLSAPSCCTKHAINIAASIPFGKVEADLAEACEGTVVTLSTTPNEHCRFVEWDVKQGETPVSVSDSKFTMPDGDVTVSAVFAEIKNAVKVSDPEHGTINVTGAANLDEVLEGTELEVSVTGSGYKFTLDAYKYGETGTKVTITDGKLTMPAYDIVITANEEKLVSPTILVSKEVIDFGKAVKGGAAPAFETFTISGSNLTGDLSLAWESDDAYFAWEVTEGSLSANAGIVEATISVSVTAKGMSVADTHMDNLIVSGGGATQKEVMVGVEVQQTYTAKWFVNGEELTESTQTAIEGTNLNVPADPTKLADDCAGMVFKGWAAAEIEGKKADAPEFVTTEDLKMGNANVNYYAVFATQENTGSLEEESVSTTMSAYITANSCTVSSGNDATMYKELTLDANITLSTTGDDNCGSFWGTSPNNDWRLYQAKSGNAVLTAANGYTLKSVKFTYGASNGGVLLDGETQVATASKYDISGASKTFTVGNSGSASNGQVKITAIEIEYEKDTRSTTFKDYVTTCPECTKVTLSKAVEGNGTLVLKQSGVEVSAPVMTCEAATVDVEATPATGYELDGVAVSGVEGAAYNAGVISIPAGKEGTLNVTATFTAINYTVTMEQTGGAEAEISGNQENKHYGNEITVTAGEKAGYYFLGWAADVEVDFANAKALTTTFPMPASNVKVTAKYAKILSVADALALIPNSGDKKDDQVVEGYIKSVESYSSTYKSITYTLMDLDANGFATATTIKVFGGKGIESADFSAKDDLEVGAKARIFGQLLYHTTGGKEINSDNYQLSYTAPGAASVVVYGEAEKTYYEYGDPFQFDGLKAKQLYENGYATEIETPEWSADPAAIIANGEVTATATWNLMNGSTKVGVEVLMHEIDFNASPANGTLEVLNKGTGDPVADGDHFVKGDELVINAYAAPGYKLETLTVNGDNFTNGETYKVGTEDIVIVATFVKDSGTAIDNTEAGVKAVKMIENGVLIIRRGDKSFNAQGQLIR